MCWAERLAAMAQPLRPLAAAFFGGAGCCSGARSGVEALVDLVGQLHLNPLKRPPALEPSHGRSVGALLSAWEGFEAQGNSNRDRSYQQSRTLRPGIFWVFYDVSIKNPKFAISHFTILRSTKSHLRTVCPACS